MDSWGNRSSMRLGLRMFSRNPLMRTSDRIDAVILPLTILYVIVAAVCAAVFGSLTHDAESHRFAEEVATRHLVVATADEDSTTGIIPEPSASRVVARWRINGVEHTDLLTWDHPVKAGARLQIWVDLDGNRVDPPTPPALAGGDAVLTAATAWCISVIIAILAVGGLRSRTARMRDDQWDHVIRCLIDDGDGRANRPQ